MPGLRTKCTYCNPFAFWAKDNQPVKHWCKTKKKQDRIRTKHTLNILRYGEEILKESNPFIRIPALRERGWTKHEAQSTSTRANRNVNASSRA